MANKTPNLNLTKLELTDTIGSIPSTESDNATILDTEIANLKSRTSRLENSNNTTVPDGSITAAKLAQSAKNALLGGMTVKIFGNEINGMDNTGASFPGNIHITGGYIPALDILAIWSLWSDDYNTAWSRDNPVYLPTYVPSLIMPEFNTVHASIIEWNSSSDWVTWHGLDISDRKLFTPKTVNNPFASTPVVIFCAPYHAGSTNSITSFSAAVASNGTV